MQCLFHFLARFYSFCLKCFLSIVNRCRSIFTWFFFTYFYSEKSSHCIQLVQKLILRIEAILTKTIKMKWVYPFPLWHSCRMDLIFQLISFSCIFNRNLLKAYHCLFHLNNRSGHCFGCLLFGWYLSAKLNNP